MTRRFLERLSSEVAGQPKALREFSRSSIARAPQGSLIVGAGDSYAAALAAFYISRGSCIALDPYALAASPEMAAGREVFFISISGRTIANIAASKMIRGIAKRTTALTVDDGSPLAAATDRILRLPFTPIPKSPGLLSFSLSLLAALMVTTGEVSPIDLRRVFKAAESDTKRVLFGRGTTYFLGNSAGYSAAVYSAAKVYEMLGSKAEAELLEEFSHMELFSLKRSDSVNIFSCFDPLDRGKRLRRALLDRGYEARVIPSRGGSEVEQLFHSVFVAQLAVLGKAKAINLAKPRFQTATGKLKISDTMIY
jgi:glutamine---fructose-6-phosphate transaminase (isomerizing)